MTTEQSKAKPKQSLLLIGVLPSFALEHKSGSLGGTSHMLTIQNNKLNLTWKDWRHVYCLYGFSEYITSILVVYH